MSSEGDLLGYNTFIGLSFALCASIRAGNSSRKILGRNHCFNLSDKI